MLRTSGLSVFALSLALGLVSLSVSAPQAQAIEVTPVLVGTFPHFKYSIDPGDAGFNSKLSPGFGVLVNIPLTVISLQTGLLYVTKSFGIDDQSGFKDFYLKFKSLQVPVLARISPFPMLTVGLGGYYALGVGKITAGAAFNDPQLPPNSRFDESGSYADTQFKRSDFGLEAAVGLKVPVDLGISIVGDARYLFGLLNRHTGTSGSMKTRDLEFLAGVSFDI
ncbi:MAG: outer membrane beta-barrel protein [Methylotenera sp.]|nr:outer membrane beta-barrel protein [Oligoflexia bacterium]